MNWNFQNTYTNLPSIYYSKVKPHNFDNPKLILFNEELANELNLKINNNEKEICEFLLGKGLDNKNFIRKLMQDINLDILQYLVMEELYY